MITCGECKTSVGDGDGGSGEGLMKQEINSNNWYGGRRGGVWGGARIACEQILQLKRSNIKGTHGDGDGEGEGEEEDNDDDDDDDQTKKWHLIL